MNASKPGNGKIARRHQDRMHQHEHSSCTWGTAPRLQKEWDGDGNKKEKYTYLAAIDAMWMILDGAEALSVGRSVFVKWKCPLLDD